MKLLPECPSCFHHLISFDPVHNSVKRGSGITVPVFHHLWIDINLLKSKTAGSKPEDHQQKTSVLFETSFRRHSVLTSKGNTILKLYNCAKLYRCLMYELRESNNLGIFWVNIFGVNIQDCFSLFKDQGPVSIRRFNQL